MSDSVGGRLLSLIGILHFTLIDKSFRYLNRTYGGGVGTVSDCTYRVLWAVFYLQVFTCFKGEVSLNKEIVGRCES